jgi:acyl-homoserine-lactone acylase
LGLRIDTASRLAITVAMLAIAMPVQAACGNAAKPSAGPVAPPRDVSITRDDWGIAHVEGKSDADAVFGAIYAQAEDDFSRIEANYLVNLGRTR